MMGCRIGRGKQGRGRLVTLLRPPPGERNAGAFHFAAAPVIEFEA